MVSIIRFKAIITPHITIHSYYSLGTPYTQLLFTNPYQKEKEIKASAQTGVSLLFYRLTLYWLLCVLYRLLLYRLYRLLVDDNMTASMVGSK